MRNLTRKKCLFAVKETQKSNKTFSTIARQLHCDRRTVSRIVAHFNETGLLNEGQRPGRPTSLTEGQQRSLDNSTSESVNVHYNDIVEILDFFPRTQRTKARPTQIQVEKRHLFAVEHQNSDLKKWIFIDETQVQLRSTGKIVWVKRGEPTLPHEISSFRACVNLWGALLASHLGPHVHKCRRYAAAQDKLRSHWTVSVRQWFDDNGLKLLDWPAHSPEFNAIEYVWHLLKETVKTAQPKSQAELEAVVDQACHLISQKVIQGCISHISTLLKEEASN
ncbi:unnamed protein product [Rotaria sp. Silwood1]|nr:unnamed protein product [Rotaria sp. Silwood1]CAF4845408.1 unnamed protein product [Rotaria sp. Silwood1]CAF4925967.1 unnamed protein product [Rotaria sp. Silwood1]